MVATMNENSEAMSQIGEGKRAMENGHSVMLFSVKSKSAQATVRALAFASYRPRDFPMCFDRKAAFFRFAAADGPWAAPAGLPCRA